MPGGVPTNGVFTPEQDDDKTNVEPVHSYDAFHTRHVGPVSCSGVKTPSEWPHGVDSYSPMLSLSSYL